MSPSVSIARDMAAQIAATLEKRGEAYGPPEDNFRGVAFGWNWWLKARSAGPLTPTDVAVMNAIQKLARLAVTPTHTDSGLDAAAYVLLAVALAHGSPAA